MKSKVLCIFLMLAGIAVIVGLILFSLGRSGIGDTITFYTPILLSLVTIAAAAFHMNEPDEASGGKKALLGSIFIVSIAAAILVSLSFIVFSPKPIFFILVAITVATWFRRVKDKPDEPEVTRRGMVFLRVFRAVSILAILVCLAFLVIMFFLMRDLSFLLHMQNVRPLIGLPLAGITVAALSLKLRAPVSGRGIGRAARCVPIVVAVTITAALGFIYLNYLPKYSWEDGENMLRSDEKFAQKDVFIDGRVEDWGEPGSFGFNPFYAILYRFNCDSYGYDAGSLHIEKGYILFNPATGAHEYTLEEEQTYSPGDWPSLFFSSSLIYEEDGQHDAVLNLYFREPWGNGEGWWDKSSSGEWNKKMKAVMVPHNFPEDEAREFLRSMGEEALKTKLLEQINSLGSKFEDMTIEVFFFGIDIGTYHDGEIVLKP